MKTKQKGPRQNQSTTTPVRKYDQPDLRVVAFKVGGHEYVADVASVQEIIRSTDLKRLDSAPEYVAGLVKRRGRIVPIVDLRKYLGLKTNVSTADSCVIVGKLPSGPVGFVVDSASELMWIKTYDFEVPSAVIAGMGAGRNAPYLQGLAHLGDRLLTMIDLTRLLTPGERHALGTLETGESATPQTLFTGELDVTVTETEQEQARADRRSLITFELSKELYGIPVTDVAEIREPLPLVPLLHVPQHILGLINLRGVILPVIDLCRKFGLERQPDRLTNRLIILKGPGYPVALWVETVHGLARLHQANFQPAPPDVAQIDPEYYDQVVRLDGRLLIELNVQKLLADTAPSA